MRWKNRIVLAALLLLCLGSVGSAQSGPSHLKSWEGKYPTQRKGKVVTQRFFGLAEIRTPLLKLLSRDDFNSLTKEYEVETPIKKIGDYLVVKVCHAHMCFEQAAFAINLSTGVIHVRMADDEKARWFASKGNESNLPVEIKSYMEDFSAS